MSQRLVDLSTPTILLSLHGARRGGRHLWANSIFQVRKQVGTTSKFFDDFPILLINLVALTLGVDLPFPHKILRILSRSSSAIQGVCHVAEPVSGDPIAECHNDSLLLFQPLLDGLRL